MPSPRQLAARAAQRLGLRAWLDRHYSGHRTIVLDGQRLRVPRVQGLSCTASEPWMLELLRQVLPLKSGRFLDVGVNLGQTLVKLRRLAPRRDYLGIEPNPACLHYLRLLVRELGYEGVQFAPVGLFERDGLLSLEFFSDDPADASASLIGGYRPNRVHRRSLVPVLRYEAVEAAAGAATLGVVKIDVEGAELEVLRGLLPALRRDRPVLLMEVLPAYRADNRVRIERQQALAALLGELDYRLHRVRKSPAGDYLGLDAVADFGVHGDLQLCDYLILPAGLAAPGATPA